jgi:hypothetical protein
MEREVVNEDPLPAKRANGKRGKRRKKVGAVKVGQLNRVSLDGIARKLAAKSRSRTTAKDEVLLEPPSVAQLRRMPVNQRNYWWRVAQGKKLWPTPSSFRESSVGGIFVRNKPSRHQIRERSRDLKRRMGDRTATVAMEILDDLREKTSVQLADRLVDVARSVSDARTNTKTILPRDILSAGLILDELVDLSKDQGKFSKTSNIGRVKVKPRSRMKKTVRKKTVRKKRRALKRKRAGGGGDPGEETAAGRTGTPRKKVRQRIQQALAGRGGASQREARGSSLQAQRRALAERQLASARGLRVIREEEEEE